MDWQVDGQLITVSGELSHNTLRQDAWVTLNEKQRQAMVAHKQGSLCFGDIRHIDSAGLAWVLNLLRDARKHDVIFSLKNVPNELIQLARLSGVDTLLPVTKDKP